MCVCVCVCVRVGVIVMTKNQHKRSTRLKGDNTISSIQCTRASTGQEAQYTEQHQPHTHAEIDRTLVHGRTLGLPRCAAFRPLFPIFSSILTCTLMAKLHSMMMVLVVVGLLLLVPETLGSQQQQQQQRRPLASLGLDGSVHEDWAIEVYPSTTPEPMVRAMVGSVDPSLALVKRIAGLPGFYLVRDRLLARWRTLPSAAAVGSAATKGDQGSRALSRASHVTRVLRDHPMVLRAEHQRLHMAHKRAALLPTDPEFPRQWHLRNTGQSEGTPGIDVNVAQAWDQGITGKGILISIVDDGLQWLHPDISPRYNRTASRNYTPGEPSDDPTPNVEYDFHGTACAGTAAAAAFNGVCGASPAYDAQLAGVRLLAAPYTDASEAEAVTHAMDMVDVYSCSWGPADDGTAVVGPGMVTLAALQHAVAVGRGGKGNIFMWAGGNGR